MAIVDDDKDEHFIFSEAIDEIPVFCSLLLFNSALEFNHYLSDLGNPVPRIVFLDLNLNTTNGKELLKQLRKKHSKEDVYVIIYTRSASSFDVYDCFELGANLYLSKTNNFSNLKGALILILVQKLYLKRNLNREDFHLNGE